MRGVNLEQPLRGIAPPLSSRHTPMACVVTGSSTASKLAGSERDPVDEIPRNDCADTDRRARSDRLSPVQGTLVLYVPLLYFASTARGTPREAR